MKNIRTPKGTELPITDLRGKPYLEVKYRLVWFREERPDWGIETEICETNDSFTRARATIKNEAGRIMAQAHKVEHKAHFADHTEKAETSAIGRALSLCGYGTQFSPEIEEGERIVDSPAERPKAPKKDPPLAYSPSAKKVLEEPPVNHAPQKGGISEAQAKRLFAIAKSRDWENPALQGVLNQAYNVTASRDLDKFSYDELVNAIQSGASPEDIIKAKRG